MSERNPWDKLTLAEVMQALGLTSRNSLTELINEKKFPAGIPISVKGGKLVWLWLDVQSYLHLQSRLYSGMLVNKKKKGTEGEEDDPEEQNS